MAEEALDLRMAWAIRCLVRYPRELSVRLSFVIFMSFLDHVLDYTIRSIKTTISVLNKLAVVVTSIAGGTRSFVVVILVSFLRSSGPVNI